MTIEHFKAEGIELTKDVSSIVYVDGVNGDDSNSGDITSPKKTIGGAVTAIIDKHGGAGSIKVAAGTYAETITLEDETLTRIYIESLEGSRSVIVNALSSTQDNENLTELVVQDVDFSGNIDIECDVSGSSLCSERLFLNNMRIDGSLTLKCMGGGKATGTRDLHLVQLYGAFIVENVAGLRMFHCKINSTQSWEWNTANPEPASGSSIVTRLENCWLRGFPATTSDKAFGVTVSYYGCFVGGYGSTPQTVGADTTVSLFSGSRWYANNPASGNNIVLGTLNIEAGANLDLSTTDLSSATILFLGENVEPVNEYWVDGTNGDDQFTGVKEYPLATVNAAVSAIAGSDGYGVIHIKGNNTYSETVTLENAALRQVELIGYNGGVTVDGDLQSTLNNKDLELLRATNITFTGVPNLVCTEDGAASLFCSAGTSNNDPTEFISGLYNCDFTSTTGTANFKTMKYFDIVDTDIMGAAAEFTNIYGFTVTNGRVPASTILSDDTEPAPAAGQAMWFYLRNESNFNGQVTLSKSAGGSTPRLFIWGRNAATNPGGVGVSVADGCQLDFFEGRVPEATVAAGGIVNINSTYDRDRVIGDISNWSIDPAATLSITKPGSTGQGFKSPVGPGQIVLTGATILNQLHSFYHLVCNTSGGAFAVTLPVVTSSHEGLEIEISCVHVGGANALTVNPDAGHTVGGGASYSLSANTGARFRFNGTLNDWVLV